jgi:hypothetical protein
MDYLKNLNRRFWMISIEAICVICMIATGSLDRNDSYDFYRSHFVIYIIATGRLDRNDSYDFYRSHFVIYMIATGRLGRNASYDLRRSDQGALHTWKPFA